jgi:hypothetical protein
VSCLLQFLDNRLEEDFHVIRVTRRRSYTPREVLVLISVSGRIDLVSGLGRLEKCNDVIRNLARDHLAFNIVLKLSTLPCGPILGMATAFFEKLNPFFYIYKKNVTVYLYINYCKIRRMFYDFYFLMFGE